MTIRFYILALTFAILLLAGCAPSRHLKGKERLLYDVSLNGADQSDPAKIEALYRQRPNRKVPFLGIMPYLSVYYFGKSFYNPARIQAKIERENKQFAEKIRKAGADSAKTIKLSSKRTRRLERLTKKKEEGNWLMRTIGEPPSIYDSLLTVETASQINTYLNSKGFFHNQVSYKTREKGKKIFLTLDITEGEPFKYTEIGYQIPDSTVLSLVRSTESATFLKKGNNYDEELLTLERDRLEDLMRNRGFYDFRKQFITFDVDTSFGGNSVHLKTVISNPADSLNHKRYKLRKVYFVGDAGQDRFGLKRDTVVFNRVHYAGYRKYVSTKVLDKKIRIKPGQDYSLIRTNRTQKQISDLDVYRFSAINYNVVKNADEPLLDAFVNATPAKRYQSTEELGFNLSSFTGSRINPLPFGNVRLKVRNIFGGAENLEFGVRAGLEGQPSSISTSMVTTTELGANVGLSFPQFLIPFINLDNNPNLVVYNPRTRVNLAYTYTDREDYTRTNTELTLDYYWQRSQRLQYVVSLVDINLVDATINSAEFEARLDLIQSNGVPLRQAFKTAIVSSSHATMLYNSNNINQTLDAKFFKLFVEIGNLPRVLSLGSIKSTPYQLLSDGVEKISKANEEYNTFSFFKINADYRRYFKLKEKQFLVGRVNLGLASPVFGSENSILPYDKFFFAGGGSSVRAWRPRKLGPGSFTPPNRQENGEDEVIDGYVQRDYRQERPGEILMEGNIEYRFNIFSYLNGALFVDAGNVWNIKGDSTQPEAAFGKNFYREIAVGTGFGLRFDFSFLIIRFDLATKVFDPAEPLGERFVLNRFRVNKDTFNARNMQNSFNLGIGYPF